MVTTLTMSVKMAILGLFKINVSRKKGYGVIMFFHDVINKVLSCDSNYTVDVIMWPKFGNSNISVREVIITIVLGRFDKENHIFWWVLLVKFNNLGLALDMVLKFYTSLAKGLKLKVRKFRGLIFMFVEITGGKLVGGPFCTLPSLNILKNTKPTLQKYIQGYFRMCNWCEVIFTVFFGLLQLIQNQGMFNTKYYRICCI